MRILIFCLALLPACGVQPPEGTDETTQELNYCNGVPCPQGSYCDGTSCVPICKCGTPPHSRKGICSDDGSGACSVSCIYPWIDADGIYSNGCEHYGIYCYYYPPYPPGYPQPSPSGYCCYEGGGCWPV